jgi:hypothetical protein
MRRYSKFYYVLILLGLSIGSSSWADEDLEGERFPSLPQAIPQAAQEPSVETEDSKSEKPVKKKPKGRIAREKEAEGTKAPNRFDTEVVIKSDYRLNGQSLEVDTD